MKITARLIRYLVASLVIAAAPASAQESGWRSASLTSGSWTYRQTGSGSIADFATGRGVALSLRCDATARRLTLSATRGLSSARSGSAPDGQLIVRTTFGDLSWPILSGGASSTFAAERSASDTGFDQIAFSRGRFAVDLPGGERVIAPKWAEVVRVIEDCRG